LARLTRHYNSTFRFSQLLTSSQSIFSQPGRGPRKVLHDSFESLRHRLQAFDSTILEQFE